MRVALDIRVLQQAARVSRGGVGGVGRYVEGLSDALLERGDDIEYVFLLDRGAVPARVAALIERPAVSVARIGFPGAIAPLHYGRAGAFTRSPESGLVDRQLRRLRVDVVHFPDQPAPRVSLPRVVITIHDLWGLVGGRAARLSGPFGARQRAALERTGAGGVLASCVSQATADDARRVLGLPSERIVVCHPGVDLERFSPTDRSGDQPTYFLHVGALRERKNPRGLLEAFARVARETPARLVCVGPYHLAEAAAERVRALALSLGVSDRVDVADRVSDDELVSLYRGAAALVFPSLHEGFGLPVVEALACGTPVVTSGRASLREVGGELALYADAEDADAIAAAMLRTMTDGALRERVRDEGPVWAARFSWSATATGTVDIYRRLARGSVGVGA